MGNRKPGHLGGCKGGLRDSRFVPDSDDLRECGNLCLRLLELLVKHVKACMLRDLHRGMLKLFSIGQQDGKEADLPPLAQKRPASFWLPGSDAQSYLARRVGGPVGEMVGSEREEGNMRHGTHPRQQFIFLCSRAGVLRPLRGDALLNRRARAASGAAERELTFLRRLRHGTILPLPCVREEAVEKSLSQVAVKSHTPNVVKEEAFERHSRVQCRFL